MHTTQPPHPFLLLMVSLFFFISCKAGNNEAHYVFTDQTQSNESMADLKKATFGAGCFWCVEAIFQQVKGVKSVTSGYSGGQIENPTYREVSSKKNRPRGSSPNDL